MTMQTINVNLMHYSQCATYLNHYRSIKYNPPENGAFGIVDPAHPNSTGGSKTHGQLYIVISYAVNLLAMHILV